MVWQGDTEYMIIASPQVITMLVILMVGEVSVAVLAILAKSLIETDLERDLLGRLREEYNMMEREVFTRAVDLAQTQVYYTRVGNNPSYKS